MIYQETSVQFVSYDSIGRKTFEVCSAFGGSMLELASGRINFDPVLTTDFIRIRSNRILQCPAIEMSAVSDMLQL